MNISSPCVNVCHLDKHGVCMGCLRTLEEIARWTRMTDDERSLVLTALKARQKNSGRQTIAADQLISCYTKSE